MLVDWPLVLTCAVCQEVARNSETLALWLHRGWWWQKTWHQNPTAAAASQSLQHKISAIIIFTMNRRQLNRRDTLNRRQMGQICRQRWEQFTDPKRVLEYKDTKYSRGWASLPYSVIFHWLCLLCHDLLLTLNILTPPPQEKNNLHLEPNSFL